MWCRNNKVMFGMHTLKNYVHYNQSVITINLYWETWCNWCYVWLIIPYLKYDVIIVIFNWLHIILNMIVVMFIWLHLIWNVMWFLKCDLHYYFSKCTLSLKPLHITTSKIQMWCAKGLVIIKKSPFIITQKINYPI